jgi:hypothetical protein
MRKIVVLYFQISNFLGLKPKVMGRSFLRNLNDDVIQYFFQILKHKNAFSLANDVHISFAPKAIFATNQ